MRVSPFFYVIVAPCAKLAPRTLPYDALPLTFTLVRPLSGSTSPCACLVASLPLRSTWPSSDATLGSKTTVQDLSHGDSTPTIQVVRILDPEQREPFVSLGRILLACRITPVEGLLRYELERPSYDCTLGGIAPFYDIWVPLQTARDIAKDLGVLDQLAGLLEWETRKAWSVEDKEQGGIVHNWKIASDRIAPPEYSTQRMMSASFPRIHLLPTGSQIRTLLPPASTFESYRSYSNPSTMIESDRSQPSFAALWIKLTEWSVHEYENRLEWTHLVDGDQERSSSPSSSLNGSTPSIAPPVSTRARSTEPSLTPLFLFSTIVPLLSLSGSLPPASVLPNRVEHLGDTVLSRSELLPSLLASSSDDETTLLDAKVQAKGKLYLVDAIARFALDSFSRQQARPAESARQSSERSNGEDTDWRNRIEERLELLERALSSRPTEDKDPGEEARRPVEAAEDELRTLRERIRFLEKEAKSTTEAGTDLPSAAESDTRDAAQAGALGEAGGGNDQRERDSKTSKSQGHLGERELMRVVDHAGWWLISIAVIAFVLSRLKQQ